MVFILVKVEHLKEISQDPFYPCEEGGPLDTLKKSHKLGPSKKGVIYVW